ncbi:MAG: hypothetical protein HY231_18340 [Acidobacteria bacterium]|nr:hypothetical protein [Acidobacteriota bacterium]
MKTPRPQGAPRKATTPEGKSLPKSKELTEAIKRLKADLEKEIALRQYNIQKLADDVDNKKALFAAGIVAKGEVEKSEVQLAAAHKELTTRAQIVNQEIAQADELLTEINGLEQLAKRTSSRLGAYSATAALIRYNGASAWTLTNIANVERFFVAQFGHSLPISAFGQTATHDRLGFDHRNSVDVAVHPDSPEGQAILQFLRSAGLPFLAFRQAVPGAATGAHIHIGYPSHRILGK